MVVVVLAVVSPVAVGVAAFDDLVQPSALQPYAPALRAVVDLHADPLGHHQRRPVVRALHAPRGLLAHVADRFPSTVSPAPGAAQGLPARLDPALAPVAAITCVPLSALLTVSAAWSLWCLALGVSRRAVLRHGAPAGRPVRPSARHHGSPILRRGAAGLGIIRYRFHCQCHALNMCAARPNGPHGQGRWTPPAATRPARRPNGPSWRGHTAWTNSYERYFSAGSGFGTVEPRTPVDQEEARP